MREIESNFRGFKSESGILMENAFSSALTMSGSANESSRPESNSDSSGSAGGVFLEMVRMMSAICSCLFICYPASQLLADLRVLFVIVHQVPEQRVAEAAVTRPGEVHVIVLRQAGRHPLLHGALAAHLLAHVPE